MHQILICAGISPGFEEEGVFAQALKKLGPDIKQFDIFHQFVILSFTQGRKPPWYNSSRNITKMSRFIISTTYYRNKAALLHFL